MRDAVLALVNSQTWVASRSIMRAEQENLFAPGADDFFAELLTRNKDDARAVRLLTSRRTLLAQAKSSGIDAAYAGLITPQYISSLQHEMQTLRPGEPRRADVVRALLGLTADDNRLQRGHLQYELAMSLLNDSGESRARSIEAAADSFREALALITRDDDPELWARLQIGLADTLTQIAGRVDLAGDAIDHYEAALTYWSAVDAKLGRSIERLVATLRTARANRAPDLDTRLQDLLRASALMRREDDAEAWARLQHNLGETYRVRASASRDNAEMECAIAYFEHALEVFTPTTYPVDFGLAANSLGAAYLERRAGERSANIERGIELLDAALAVRPHDKFPDYWAKTQINLGGAYMMRVAGERGQNVEAAIQHLLAPLDDSPSEWIAAQRGGIERQLAEAYLERESGARPENLDSALQHARKAVEVLEGGAGGDELALAQWLVGHALAARPRSTTETDEAIASFEQGLAVQVTFERALDRGKAMQALAGLYEYRTLPPQAANLVKAIEHYEAARAEYERADMAAGAAICDYWIGSVIRKRPDLPEQARLTAAIEHFCSALKRFPHDGPATLRVDMNIEMAHALADFAAGDRGANLQTAIAHYDNARGVLKRAGEMVRTLVAVGAGRSRPKDRAVEQRLAEGTGAVDAVEALRRAAE